MALSGWSPRPCTAGGGPDQEGPSGLGLGAEARATKAGGVGLLPGNSTGTNSSFPEGGAPKGGCTTGRQYPPEGILLVRLAVWGGRAVHLNAGVLARHIPAPSVSEAGVLVQSRPPALLPTAFASHHVGHARTPACGFRFLSLITQNS